MFVRFRHTKTQLQVYVVENRRLQGTIRRHHVASLGPLPRQPTPRDRIAFWQDVNEQMLALSKRIDTVKQEMLRVEIHARVPLPTVEEQRRMQLENEIADACIWAAARWRGAMNPRGACGGLRRRRLLSPRGRGTQ